MKNSTNYQHKSSQTTMSRRTFAGRLFACGAMLPFAGVLAACSSTSNSAPASDSVPAASVPVEAPAVVEEAAQTQDAPSSSTLVVYFSATGNTERVAQTVVDRLGADVFTIVPAQPYSTADLDWTNPSSRVNAEHDDPEGRDVQVEQVQIPSLEKYDTVFFGYPTWWQQASWVVYDVAQGNDFTGKKVYPFTTSQSSPLGDSAENLAALAGTGDWQEGVRFRSSVSADDVLQWLEGLDV